MKAETITTPSHLLRLRDSIYASDLLICAVAHFDFFTFVRDASPTLEEIRRGLETAARPTEVMLTLFLAMGLIEKVGERYRLTSLSGEYLVSDHPNSMAAYYASLEQRPQVGEFYTILKTGQPAGWSSQAEGEGWLEAMRDEQFAAAFTAAMDSRGAFLAQELAARLDLSQHDALLDVAGGSGIYAGVLAQQNSELKAAVLEILPVDRAARRSLQAKGMAERVQALAGDMFKTLPTGYDVHLWANVLHDWDLASVEKLLQNSFDNLRPPGLIVIFDAHLNDDKDGPLSIAEYSCLLMHSTAGRCYSSQEISQLLQKTGFTQVETTPIAADRTMIVGRKVGD